MNLAGLDLRDVPPAVFSIIDAPLPSSAPTYSGSFGDDAGGDRWWENESIHVPGGVAKLNLGRNALEMLPDDLALLPHPWPKLDEALAHSTHVLSVTLT